MRLETNEKGEIILKEVYSGVTLEASSGESIGICMRDTGFEFNYFGVWYEAKNGEVRKLSKDEEEPVCDHEKVEVEDDGMGNTHYCRKCGFWNF